MNAQKEFGERLKKARESKNLTQTELALKLGKKSYKSVGEWESGKQMPPITTLTAICEVLNCSADYLLHGKTVVEEPPEGYELIKTSEWLEVLRQANKNLKSENESLKNN